MTDTQTPTVNESLPVQPPSGAREPEEKVVNEAARFTNVPPDRARAFLGTLKLCGYTLTSDVEWDTLSDRLRVAENLVSELKIADFALRERTGHLTALEDVHRQRYENMRAALGVTYPTAEQIVGAAIAAIHERTQLHTTNARLERVVEEYPVPSTVDIATIKHGVRMLEAISERSRKHREQLLLKNPDGRLSFAKHNACAALLRLANRELKRAALAEVAG